MVCTVDVVKMLWISAILIDAIEVLESYTHRVSQSSVTMKAANIVMTVFPGDAMRQAGLILRKWFVTVKMRMESFAMRIPRIVFRVAVLQTFLVDANPWLDLVSLAQIIKTASIVIIVRLVLTESARGGESQQLWIMENSHVIVWFVGEKLP